MQAALGRYAAAERLPLALRIGVGAGEVVVLDVGGERERRELLVAGAAVPQTTDAAGRALPGQVVLSQAAMRPAGARPRRPGAAAGPGPPPAAAGARRPAAALVAPYLPRAMLASMVAGHEEWLAELRQITVVFANLPDLDHRAGLDEAQEVMAALQRRPVPLRGQHQQAERRREGHHPGGGARAAAPGPRGRPGPGRPGRPWPCARPWPPAAAGSRSGSPPGAPSAARSAAAGAASTPCWAAVVNLAARLMQEAGDGVLCDAATAQAARAALAFEALPPVRVKGRADPVPVYRPGRPRPGGPAGGRSRWPGPRWSGGRTSGSGWPGALGRLTAGGDGGPGRCRCWSWRARPGPASRAWSPSWSTRPWPPGCRCWPGPGTRSSATPPGTPGGSCSAGCPAFDGDRPGGPPPPGARPARARTPRTATWPRCSTRCWAWSCPRPPASAELSGQGRAGRTRDLLVRLLRAVVGETPTVLVIEDAHWLDSASTGLVLALSRERLPLLLVVATRSRARPGRSTDDLAWAAYRRLLRAPDIERLVLDRLSSDGGRGPWSASGSATSLGPRGPGPAGRGARPRATRCSPRS